MQICLLNTIKSFILKMFFLFSISFSFILIRMFISFRAKCICSRPALTIFTATYSPALWSNALTTSPKAPLPRPYKSSYLYPTCSCCFQRYLPQISGRLQQFIFKQGFHYLTMSFAIYSVLKQEDRFLREKIFSKKVKPQ